MHEPPADRTVGLAHHLEQASGWLDASQNGHNATALSYAAFELRLAIERLAVHYWLALRSAAPTAAELQRFSFKKVEQEIYALAGNQKKIATQFEFMRSVLDALQIALPLPTPDIGKLSKRWHETSELCHVLWTFASTDERTKAEAFRALGGIRDELAEQITGLAGFPSIDNPEFASLRDDFIDGRASADDVRAFLAKRGAWAKARYPDGRPSEFIGQAIPPAGGP